MELQVYTSKSSSNFQDWLLASQSVLILILSFIQIQIIQVSTAADTALSHWLIPTSKRAEGRRLSAMIFSIKTSHQEEFCILQLQLLVLSAHQELNHNSKHWQDASEMTSTWRWVFWCRSFWRWRCTGRSRRGWWWSWCSRDSRRCPRESQELFDHSALVPGCPSSPPTRCTGSRSG